MSTDSPQEPPKPTPARRRVRLPAVSRIATAIALALVALAVGGAGLGLAIADRLSEDERGAVTYLSRVDVGHEGERFGPAPGAKRGFDRGRSRVGRSPFTKDMWDRGAVGKHGARSPTRADANASAGMVIAIGEVTGMSDDTISVFTILGNDLDIGLRESAQAEGVAVGGWAVVMAERTADGLVARWVRPMSPPDEFRDRARLQPAVAS